MDGKQQGRGSVREAQWILKVAAGGRKRRHELCVYQKGQRTKECFYNDESRLLTASSFCFVPPIITKQQTMKSVLEGHFTIITTVHKSAHTEVSPALTRAIGQNVLKVIQVVLCCSVVFGYNLYLEQQLKDLHYRRTLAHYSRIPIIPFPVSICDPCGLICTTQKH